MPKFGDSSKQWQPDPGPDSGQPPRFRRALDGSILHFPPMRDRLDALRQRFQNSINGVAIMVTLPLAALLFLIAMFISFGVLFFLSAGIILALPLAILLIVGAFFLIKKLLNDKVDRCYELAVHRLITTDIGLLIAEESSWQRVREQAEGVPQLRWLGVPQLGRFEQCLLFGASYMNTILEFSNGPQPADARHVRHGSCLFWLTTSPAASLGWISGAGCMLPYLGMLVWPLVIPLFVGASRYAELTGNVLAVCDYFSTNLDRIVAPEPLPHEAPPEPPKLKPPEDVPPAPAE